MKTRLLAVMALGIATAAAAQVRREVNLGTWEFSRDSATWQTVRIPHDWAIAGPFDKKWDLQMVAIAQNGETEATEKSGRSGALPWIGRGFYRTTVRIPEGYEAAELVFDGAMSEPHVTINGTEAGYWAYGYNAFRIDATPYIGSGLLRIGVALNNVEESSRWYPGGGLYRPVKLVLTPKAHLDPWGTFIRTLSVADGQAQVAVTLKTTAPKLTVKTDILNADGQLVASARKRTDATGSAEQLLSIKNARLWSPESPYLYKAVVSLYDGRRLVDQTEQRVGLRTVSATKEGGFQLNGQTRKIKGVCLHHDLGPLGAAINRAALIRQIRTMKEMGCDAIRTAHNMPSTWQMEICDSMGMMVMAESFDMWRYPKCRNGYARFFDEWAERDITNLVLNHRNHPCIIMWSIGNEIPEQWSEEGRQIAQRLQDVCHRLDPTRPVTQGMDRAEEALSSGFAQVMDVPGFNYRVHKYPKNIEQLPQGFLLGSETASTVSSRGIYKFPVTPTDNSQFASYSPNYDPAALQQADGQCSSYDVEWCPWSNLPDDDWVWQDDAPYVIGEFVWTGYDYLGEPTPYDEYWPSRSSYFGICDLAGLPKDRYWLYRSKWNTEQHTVHLLPHWTWPGREGEVTPVYCYTDADEGELFVNGKSQGTVRKQKGQQLDRYRLRWNDVKYEPGEIKVVVKYADGTELSAVCRTADEPITLYAETDRTEYRADGEDLVFVTLSAIDADGNFVPTADNNLKFSVIGAGTFEAVCNGDATSLQSFKEPQMKLFSGQLVVVLRTLPTAGDIVLTVSDESGQLADTTVHITTK